MSGYICTLSALYPSNIHSLSIPTYLRSTQRQSLKTITTVSIISTILIALNTKFCSALETTWQSGLLTSALSLSWFAAFVFWDEFGGRDVIAARDPDSSFLFFEGHIFEIREEKCQKREKSRVIIVGTVRFCYFFRTWQNWWSRGLWRMDPVWPWRPHEIWNYGVLLNLSDSTNSLRLRRKISYDIFCVWSTWSTYFWSNPWFGGQQHI